jgi:hypothetical protein
LAGSLPAAEAALVIGDAGDREAGLAALDDARGMCVHGM